MRRGVAILFIWLASVGAFGADLSADRGMVKVDPAMTQGSRPLAKETANAVVRDYLEAWQNLSAALEQNRTTSKLFFTRRKGYPFSW